MTRTMTDRWGTFLFALRHGYPRSERGLRKVFDTLGRKIVLVLLHQLSDAWIYRDPARKSRGSMLPRSLAIAVFITIDYVGLRLSR